MTSSEVLPAGISWAVTFSFGCSTVPGGDDRLAPGDLLGVVREPDLDRTARGVRGLRWSTAVRHAGREQKRSSGDRKNGNQAPSHLRPSRNVRQPRRQGVSDYASERDRQGDASTRTGQSSQRWRPMLTPPRCARWPSPKGVSVWELGCPDGLRSGRSPSTRHISARSHFQGCGDRQWSRIRGQTWARPAVAQLALAAALDPLRHRSATGAPLAGARGARSRGPSRSPAVPARPSRRTA